MMVVYASMLWTRKADIIAANEMSKHVIVISEYVWCIGYYMI